MGIEQAMQSAANMGTRAGLRFRDAASATRNPFSALPGPGQRLAQAWTQAYVDAAYRRNGGAAWPADPAGRGHGATSWGALTAAAPDGAGQTAPVTNPSDDEWATGLAAVRDAGLDGGAAAAALRAAADAGNTGAAIMAYLAPDDAQRLALPGGDPAEDLHVTLGYLSEPAADYSTDERQALQDALAAVWAGSVTASPFALAHFNRNDPEREPCVTILVQSADLTAAHDAVDEAIAQAGVQSANTFPTWVPHITLGYNLDPATVPDDATGPDVTFDRLIVAWGDEQVPITTAALTAATEDDMTAPAPTTDDAAPAAPTEPATDTATEPAEPGWSGPLALLSTPSSDHRILTANGRIRTLPQPLNFQERNEGGHYGSTVVGAVREVEIRGGQIWGRGTYLGGWNEDVERARQQVADGLGLVSVDLVPGEVWFVDAAGNPIDPMTYTGDFDDIFMVNDDWEFGGVTIVGFPAFDGVRITNDPPPAGDIGQPVMMPGGDASTYDTFAAQNATGAQVAEDGESVTLPDGSTVRVGDPVLVPNADGDGDADPGTITAIDADAQTVTVQIAPDGDADDGTEPTTVTVPVTDIRPTEPVGGALPTTGGQMAATPPATLAEQAIDTLLASSYAEPYTAAFFAQRELTGPTPLTVNRDTGEVFGHLCQWRECHIGELSKAGMCTTAPVPKDPSFPYFHLGEVNTDAGPLPIGKITVGGGHASRRAGLMAAVEHYDNTCAQVAVVRAYPDDYGIQVTGQLIHGVEPGHVEEMMRAGQLSGDWRKPRGDWELVAALAVNVPGFPVRRPTPKYGFIADRQVSLVAAGVVEPEPAATTDVVRLPSGAEVGRSDWEAMVAAAAEAFQSAPTKAQASQQLTAIVADAGLGAEDRVALQRAQARLRLRQFTGRKG